MVVVVGLCFLKEVVWYQHTGRNGDLLVVVVVEPLGPILRTQVMAPRISDHIYCWLFIKVF